MNTPEHDIRFDRATHVRELQRMLRTLAFDDVRIPLISEDGLFGQETANAVAAAQACLKLPESGRVDYPTWVSLVGATHAVQEKNREPSPIPVLQAGDPAVQEGDDCDAALGAQMMCRSLARRFANLTAPALTGVMDASTLRGLAEMQKICDLPVTGQIDPSTWNALTQAYALFGRNAATPH